MVSALASARRRCGPGGWQALSRTGPSLPAPRATRGPVGVVRNGARRSAASWCTPGCAASSRAALDSVPEVRKRRTGARLEQHVGDTLPRPDEERRAVVGALEARAFVAGGFREPLLIRGFAVQCASRQHFAVLEGQFAEIHRAIGRVSPLIHVPASIGDLDRRDGSRHRQRQSRPFMGRRTVNHVPEQDAMDATDRQPSPIHAGPARGKAAAGR
jgi:hypothetical protein